GAHGGARRHARRERLLPDDDLLLLLRLRAARDRAARRVRTTPGGKAFVKVVVLTSSYPRHAGDVAGVFVQQTVERVRAAGVDVQVVSPSAVRHYGIAYGDGVVNNLRRRPWLLLA